MSHYIEGALICMCNQKNHKQDPSYIIMGWLRGSCDFVVTNVFTTQIETVETTRVVIKFLSRRRMPKNFEHGLLCNGLNYRPPVYINSEECMIIQIVSMYYTLHCVMLHSTQ